MQKVEIGWLKKTLELEGDLEVYVRDLAPENFFRVEIGKKLSGGEENVFVVGQFEKNGRGGEEAENYKNLWENIIKGRYKIRTIIQISKDGSQIYRIIYNDRREEKVEGLDNLTRKLAEVENAN